MPYCCQCGTNVGATQQFCSKCGTRQPVTAPPPQPPPPQPPPLPNRHDLLSDLSPRTASLLCYIPFVGWLAAMAMGHTTLFLQFTRQSDLAFSLKDINLLWLGAVVLAILIARFIPLLALRHTTAVGLKVLVVGLTTLGIVNPAIMGLSAFGLNRNRERVP